METFCEALKLLDPSLGSEQEEPVARVRLEVYAPMSDERVLKTPKSPWNEVRNGVAVKSVPIILPETLCQKIEGAWYELPVWSKDMLTTKALDGHNERLRETMQRILVKEKSTDGKQTRSVAHGTARWS